MTGGQQAQIMTVGSRPSDRYNEQNKQLQEELHESLVLDLQDKEREIHQGRHSEGFVSWIR